MKSLQNYPAVTEHRKWEIACLKRQDVFDERFHLQPNEAADFWLINPLFSPVPDTIIELNLKFY